MVMLLLLLIVATATLSSSASSSSSASRLLLPPVLFLPGYGGSELFATISSSAALSLPTPCLSLSLPTDRPFKLLDNETMTSTDEALQCVYSLLSLSFNPQSLTYSPACCHSTSSSSSSDNGKKEKEEEEEGELLRIETGFFGHFRGLAENYQPFSQVLQSWGYELYKNAFAVPYDYRFMSDATLTKIGFVDRLKALIERAYEENNQQRVILIGHSNGGPTMYVFLTSQRVTTEWKDKYIAAMISLSGNMLGQMNMIEPFVFANNKQQQEMTCSWEGTIASLSWGGYDLVKDIPIVTTYYGQEKQEKRYTTKLKDLVELFDSVNQTGWSDRLKTLYGIHPVDGSQLPTVPMDRSAHPLVDSYCLYGSNITTSYSFTFEENIESSTYPTVQWMEGDDNQDIYDNEFCKVWQRDDRPESKEYYFEAKAFPNVHHMEMCSDENVLSNIKSIIDKYTLQS